jgi:hypothetical protein
MTAKMEVYFRIYEGPQTTEDRKWLLDYPQLALHYPPYQVEGEKPLWEDRHQIGTIEYQQATLDVSEVKVRRDEDRIEISPKLNEAKRYARIVLDKETAHQLATDILNEINK